MTKIKISKEDINSEKIDAELHRQDVAERMAAHQRQVQSSMEIKSCNIDDIIAAFKQLLPMCRCFLQISPA